MVVVSHDREFLDQLCNKLVETEHGVATSYKGNYTEYVKAKEEKIGQQWAAWEKQQKEIARQVRHSSWLCIAVNWLPSGIGIVMLSGHLGACRHALSNITSKGVQYSFFDSC